MTGTILLVEDTEDDVELTRRALKRNRLTNPLVVARDGQEALDYLLGGEGGPTAAEDLPAIVLLDLQLPKVSGLDVLRKLRATRTSAAASAASRPETCSQGLRSPSRSGRRVPGRRRARPLP